MTREGLGEDVCGSATMAQALSHVKPVPVFVTHNSVRQEILRKVSVDEKSTFDDQQ
jgi:hypothetical protein